MATFTRPGDGHQKLLVRRLGNTLEPRHAANGQERHVRCGNAEAACGKDVTEFMRYHAGEQEQHEDERMPGSLRAAGHVISGKDPDEK